MNELTKREYIAVEMAKALIIKGPYSLSIEDAVPAIARAAYVLADAMIEAGRPEFEKRLEAKS